MPARKKASHRSTPRLDSPAKRMALAPRPKPYFVPAGTSRDGASLGYRRAQRGPGVWVARLLAGATWREAAIGTADDAGAALDALTFSAARAKALAWCEAQRGLLSAASAQDTRKEPLTVAAVVRDYLLARDAAASARGISRDAASARSVMAKHLTGGGRLKHPPAPLAGVRLDRLTRGDLRRWLTGLSVDLSPQSVARLVTALRAALRSAWARAGHAAPNGWDALIREGLDTKAAKRPTAAPARQVEDVRPDLLDDAAVTRLLAGCAAVDADLHRLALVLAATGLRFSQVKRIRVRDVDAARLALLVPSSAKGDTLVKETTNKPAFVRCALALDVLDALRPAMEGRDGGEPLLTRQRKRQSAGSRDAGRGAWREGRNGRPVWIAERTGEPVAWNNVADLTRMWRRAVKAAELPAGVTTYSLRDWSIIRLLKRGLDPVTVARRHDTSVAMIERAYGRHILSARDAALREAAPSFAK